MACSTSNSSAKKSRCSAAGGCVAEKLPKACLLAVCDHNRGTMFGQSLASLTSLTCNIGTAAAVPPGPYGRNPGLCISPWASTLSKVDSVS